MRVCVDDATRLTYAEVLPDEKSATRDRLPEAGNRLYRSHGIAVERLMTDNGGAYCSTAHAIACRAMHAARVGLRRGLRQLTGNNVAGIYSQSS